MKIPENINKNYIVTTFCLNSYGLARIMHYLLLLYAKGRIALSSFPKKPAFRKAGFILSTLASGNLSQSLECLFFDKQD
jgi:hypothetical protein